MHALESKGGHGARDETVMTVRMSMSCRTRQQEWMDQGQLLYKTCLLPSSPSCSPSYTPW